MFEPVVLNITMENKNHSHQKNALPEAETGNASNPFPHNKNMEPDEHNQLLDKKAENYLREAGNIEDVPDAQEQKEAGDAIKKEQH